MTYKCPACGEEFHVDALQQPAGIGGGSYCPKCHERVYVSIPYGRAVAFISLLIALGILLLLHVRAILGLIIGTLLIWIPLSLFLNVCSTRLKPPFLKKWKARRHRTRRTFFEWLYDRAAPSELFGKRRR